MALKFVAALNTVHVCFLTLNSGLLQPSYVCKRHDVPKIASKTFALGETGRVRHHTLRMQLNVSIQ